MTPFPVRVDKAKKGGKGGAKHVVNAHFYPSAKKDSTQDSGWNTPARIEERNRVGTVGGPTTADYGSATSPPPGSDDRKEWTVWGSQRHGNDDEDKPWVDEWVGTDMSAGRSNSNPAKATTKSMGGYLDASAGRGNAPPPPRHGSGGDPSSSSSHAVATTVHPNYVTSPSVASVGPRPTVGQTAVDDDDDFELVDGVLRTMISDLYDVDSSDGDDDKADVVNAW
jgi:hypothetical protein